jgi:hypothetical protein
MKYVSVPQQIQARKKGPIGPTTPKPMGSREKGGNIMGAICSFLCSCKQSANITGKQKYPGYLMKML